MRITGNPENRNEQLEIALADILIPFGYTVIHNCGEVIVILKRGADLDE